MRWMAYKNKTISIKFIICQMLNARLQPVGSFAKLNYIRKSILSGELLSLSVSLSVLFPYFKIKMRRVDQITCKFPPHSNVTCGLGNSKEDTIGQMQSQAINKRSLRPSDIKFTFCIREAVIYKSIFKQYQQGSPTTECLSARCMTSILQELGK